MAAPSKTFYGKWFSLHEHGIIPKISRCTKSADEPEKGVRELAKPAVKQVIDIDEKIQDISWAISW